MEDSDHKVIKSLFGYIARTDARVMALQSILTEIVGKSADKNEEELNELIETRYKSIYQIMLEKTEDQNASLAAELLGEYLPEPEAQSDQP